MFLHWCHRSFHRYSLVGNLLLNLHLNHIISPRHSPLRAQPDCPLRSPQGSHQASHQASPLDSLVSSLVAVLPNFLRGNRQLNHLDCRQLNLALNPSVIPHILQQQPHRFRFRWWFVLFRL